MSPERTVRGAAPAMKRELGLRDLTLFITATVVGTRWIPAAAHAGPGAVTLWVLAAAGLMAPLAVATAVLTVKYPGAGGMYLWTRNDFGPWHGFLCFWIYWLGIAFWFPSAAMFYMSSALRALGPRYAHLADNQWCVVAVSLAAVWIALGTNLVGLGIGKWTENTGAVCAWLLCATLAACAWLVSARRGSATVMYVAPHWDWGTVNLWASIAYAVTGVEVAGMMGAEIRDPRRTLPRAAALASAGILLFYATGTAAVLALLHPEQISELYGLSQSGEAAGRELGAGWLAPLVALLVTGSAVGQFGGLGTGVSRLPMAAGVDRLLPAAFGRVHPRWATPHVSILTLGAVASGLMVAIQAGDTLRAAYREMVSLTLIGGFVPFVYMFASAWKAGCRIAAVTGLGTTLVALLCTLLPGAEVPNVWLFEAKLLAGSAAMAGSAWLVYRRWR